MISWSIFSSIDTDNNMVNGNGKVTVVLYVNGENQKVNDRRPFPIFHRL